jgi:hypothetical protein
MVVGVMLVTVVPMWALGFGFFSGLPALNDLEPLVRVIVSAVAATALEAAVICVALAGWSAAHLVSRALELRSAASQRARYVDIIGDASLPKGAWSDAPPRPESEAEGPRAD